MAGAGSSRPVLGLYLHVPFCRSRCVYCGFASSALPFDAPVIDRYLAAMRREWDLRARALFGKASAKVAPRHTSGDATVQVTVYVGGGTPSWIGTERLAALVGWVLAETGRRGTAPVEVSVEVNPDSFDEAMAAALVDAGVTRLSIGAQALDDDVLAALGRPYGAADVSAAVGAARAGGVGSVSLDLICGCPGETEASWRRSVEGALALRPDHVSVYALTVEEETPLACAAPRLVGLPEEDEVADRLRWAWAYLKEHGLARYEVSNFARPGHTCLHNVGYWRQQPYVGLGAAAVSRCAAVRISAPGDVAAYIEGIEGGDLGAWEVEHLDACTDARERVMLALRTSGGTTRRDLQAMGGACGIDPLARIPRWSAAGLVKMDGERVVLTEDGILLSNEVLADLTVP